MSKGKTLILANYLSLLMWWFILTIIGSTSGLGNSFFNLGMGIYAFLLGIVLFSSAFHHDAYTPHRLAVLIGSFGMALFGLGSVLWFYYDVSFGVEIPFPSMSDFFYVMHFPFSVFSVISLSYRDIAYMAPEYKRRNLKDYLGKSFLFVSSILLLVWLISYLYSGVLFDLEMYLLFFFPIESLSITCLSFLAVLHLSKTWQKTVANWYVLVVLGYGAWFCGDVIFVYEFTRDLYFNAGYADLLYLTGSCLILLGLIGVIEGSKKEGFISPYSPIFFSRSISYSPFGLNMKKYANSLHKLLFDWIL